MTLEQVLQAIADFLITILKWMIDLIVQLWQAIMGSVQNNSHASAGGFAVAALVVVLLLLVAANSDRE